MDARNKCRHDAVKMNITTTVIPDFAGAQSGLRA